MSDYRFLVQQIWEGKSVLRAFLNLRLSRESLAGKTIDIGGGTGSSYLSFMKHDDLLDFITFDTKAGDNIDFEKDVLPAPTGTYDLVLFLNVLEHIYNYHHIVREVLRIKKPGGRLIGFVPFLMWYHPDHHDFFRYTDEALERIFKEIVNSSDSMFIEPVSKGPFIAACHMVLLMFPKLLRVPVFSLCYWCDMIVLRFRPHASRHYVLGYYFEL